MYASVLLGNVAVSVREAASVAAFTRLSRTLSVSFFECFDNPSRDCYRCAGCDALDGDFEAVFEQLRRLKERSASCAAASKYPC